MVLREGTIREVVRPFTALEVVEAEPERLFVRCGSCGVEGVAEIAPAEVAYEALAPVEAAGESLGAFALAVREAARGRDLEALRPVMASDFTFSFVGVQSAELALAAWRVEGFAALDRVPELLDRGLVTRDSALWVAPSAHLDRLDYRGLRLGFRRAPAGRWEWVFLVRSEVGG